MAVSGAGGTHGGTGRFFIGLVMMIAGGYLFLESIRVTQFFHFGHALYSFGSFRWTTGMTLIPFVFGVGFIFYNARNLLGWILAGGSLIMLGVGVMSTVQFRMRHMSAFDLVMILTLLVGGLGLFLSSLRDHSRDQSKE